MNFETKKMTNDDLNLETRDDPILVTFRVDLTLEMRQSTWLGDLMTHAEHLIKSEHSSLKIVGGTMKVLGVDKI